MTNRILIVDDDPDMCEVIAARLRRDNLDSQWVTSGEDALAALQTDSFDAVLTDIQMPRMTGIELCQQIVRARSEIPAIVMTASVLPVTGFSGGTATFAIARHGCVADCRALH